MLPGGDERLEGELALLGATSVESQGEDETEADEEGGQGQGNAPGEMGRCVESGEEGVGGVQSGGEDAAGRSGREGLAGVWGAEEGDE